MRIKIKGSLGPLQKLPEEGIEVAPFTLLIGRQGTGKSILSQLIFMFRNIGFLSRYYSRQIMGFDEEVHNNNELTPNDISTIIRKCLNSLRSKNASFLTLLSGDEAVISWQDEEVNEKEFSIKIKRYKTLQATPNKELKKFIKKELDRKLLLADRNGNAIFIPAERIAYSHILRPSEWTYLSFPDTLAFFGSALEDAALVFNKDQSEGEKRYDENKESTKKTLNDTLKAIQQISEKTLNGHPYKQGDRWRWQVNSDIEFGVDMASSGQKANWSIFLLAQAVLYWKIEGTLPQKFALHVEEPEIHLHPEAQCDLMRILIMLANVGIDVVVTTHSLTSLYVLNNMMMKYKKFGESWAKEHLNEAIDPEIVSAYKCSIRRDGTGGEVVSILDRQVGFISEQELGKVNDDLGNEFYKLLEDE